MEKIKIFAALNEDQSRLDTKELLNKTRALFIEYYIPEYTDEEFIECQILL
jgi:hypothetical protein